MTYIAYYRMSTEDQTLDMQQQVVRDFARAKNIPIHREFQDEAISGAKSNRAGFNQLKEFLSQHPRGEIKLLIYHLDRISRDIAIWVPFRTLAIETNTIILSPISGEVDLSTNLGKFRADLDIVLAEFERNRIMERTQNGMIRLLKDGKWIFAVPTGYKREKGGKVALKYPDCVIIKEALEGYANGRFSTQEEIRKYLAKNGIVKTKSTISRMLMSEFYTGFFEHPQLGIEKIKGDFEPLISLSTYSKILKKINGKLGIVYQKKRDDFPLQGILKCECGRFFTPTWCKGRKGKYPYYRCQNKECKHFKKHLSRDKVELEVKEFLSEVKPSKLVLDLYRINFKHVWEEMKTELEASKNKRKSEIFQLNQEINKLVKIASSTNSELARGRYEREIEIKEGELTLLKHAEVTQPVEMSQEKSRTVLNFILKKLEKLDEIVENEQFETRRNLLNLFFSEGIFYDPKNKCRTATFSLFYQSFELSDTKKINLEAMMQPKSNQFFSFMEEVYMIFKLCEPSI